MWDDFAERDKIERERKKYPPQEILGFRIIGMRVSWNGMKLTESRDVSFLTHDDLYLLNCFCVHSADNVSEYYFRLQPTGYSANHKSTVHRPLLVHLCDWVKVGMKVTQ